MWPITRDTLHIELTYRGLPWIFGLLVQPTKHWMSAFDQCEDECPLALSLFQPAGGSHWQGQHQMARLAADRDLDTPTPLMLSSMRPPSLSSFSSLCIFFLSPLVLSRVAWLARCVSRADERPAADFYPCRSL